MKLLILFSLNIFFGFFPRLSERFVFLHIFANNKRDFWSLSLIKRLFKKYNSAKSLSSSIKSIKFCLFFENSPTRPTLKMISLFAAQWLSSFRVKLFLKIVCVRISRSFLETLLKMRFSWSFSQKFIFTHTYSKDPRSDLIQKNLKAQYLKY